MSDPDTGHVRKCLEAVDFLVLQEIFPSETSQYADILLPGVSFAEKEGTFTNTERRVQLVRKAIEPLGEARPDWQIIMGLAELHVGRERGPACRGSPGCWQYQITIGHPERNKRIDPVVRRDYIFAVGTW